MSLHVVPSLALSSTTPPSTGMMLPLESEAVSNQYRWRKLMRSERLGDTTSGGETSEPSLCVSRSLACHRCCAGDCASESHNPVEPAVAHAPGVLSKSSVALCLASACTLSGNGNV